MRQSKYVDKIVLVGVGWSGMSALAGILYDLWYVNIVGIDAAEGEITRNLQKRWLTIIIGHGNYKINPKDLVIYSDIESIRESAELQQSYKYQKENRKRYHKPYTYNEFVAEIAKHCITVAITWTNGKSSTTALAIHALADTSKFWIGIVGALMPDYANANYVISQENRWDVKALFDHIIEAQLPTVEQVKKLLFVVEACEHREHFLLLDTDYAVITNIGYDHQDYFPSPEDYQQAFQKFVIKTKRKVIIEKSLKKSVAMQAAGEKLVIAPKGKEEFLHIFGEHRQTNAWLVEALLKQLEEDNLYRWSYHHIKRRNFHGLRRRMEFLGTMKWGASLYSDYWHHPDAINKAVQALQQNFSTKKIVAVIEPHQAQRLLSLWDDFVDALGRADQQIICPIYHARESRELVKSLRMAQKLWVENFNDIALALTKEVGWLYYDEPEWLRNKINGFRDNTIVVLFSAGSLDYHMRSKRERKP